MFTASPRSIAHAVLRLIGVIGLAVGALVVSSGSASAHHAEITGQATCAGSVDWRATAWQNNDPASRTNSRVEVSKQINGGSWEPVQTGAFNQGNGFSFSGSFSGVPEDVSAIRLRVVAVADWANGVKGGQVNYADVTVPKDCQPPAAAHPTATGDVDCSGFHVALGNTEGTAPATFTVTTPTGATETHTVPAGETKELTWPVKEDATSTVAVSSEGMKDFGLSYTADCEQPPVEEAAPTATGDVDCTGFHVTLGNTEGTAPATFTITTPTGATETHTVPAGETKELTWPVKEDATSTVAVSSEGMKDFGLSYTADCEQPPVEEAAPTATGDVDCTGFHVTLGNTEGTAPATFTITTPTGATETHTVPAGGSKELTWPVKEDATSTVKVAAGASEARQAFEGFTLTYTADCVQIPTEPQQPPTDTPEQPTSPPVSGPPSPATPPAAGPPSTELTQAPALPATGSPVSPWLVLLGLGLTVGGGALLVRRSLT